MRIKLSIGNTFVRGEDMMKVICPIDLCFWSTLFYPDTFTNCKTEMFFSKTCEYAIKIMIHLKAEHKEGQWLGVREIAQAIDSPEPFTSKILQQLVKAGLLNSMRGPSGGFHLNDAESKLNLLDVVKAIDGDGIIKKCVLGFHECSADRPCAVHDELVAVRDHLASILSNTSVKKIADGVKNNREILT